MADVESGEGVRMTHVRLWRFEVPAETEEQFVAAYRSDGEPFAVPAYCINQSRDWPGPRAMRRPSMKPRL